LSGFQAGKNWSLFWQVYLSGLGFQSSGSYVDMNLIEWIFFSNQLFSNKVKCHQTPLEWKCGEAEKYSH